MTPAKFLKSSVAASMVLLTTSSFAAPTVLDFNAFSGKDQKEKAIEEDGYTISSNCTQATCFSFLSLANNNFAAYTGIQNTTTLKSSDGKLFALLSIDLDNLYSRDDRQNIEVEFEFKHAVGKDTKQTIVLTKNSPVATFTFTESNLLSASWTSSQFIRFDSIQTSAVPEPSTLALLPLGLGVVFLASRRRKAAAK